MPAQLRILLADDHEMIRMAMRTALAPLAERIEWHEAASTTDVLAVLSTPAAEEFDLALLDFNMPGANGSGWIAQLRADHPTLPLIVVSAEEDPELVRALIGCGVSGFIPKSDSAAVIRQAVMLVLSGGTYAPLRLLNARPLSAESEGRPGGLTARQIDVLRLLARGLPNKLIARELGLSEATVKVHLLAIFRVLDVHNRTEAVIAAQKRLRAPGP